jgi:hypothetical protein
MRHAMSSSRMARPLSAVAAGLSASAVVGLCAAAVLSTGGRASAATQADGLSITVSRSSDFVGRDIGFAFAKFTVMNSNPAVTVDSNSGLRASAVGGAIVAYEFTKDGVEDECMGLVCYGGPDAGQTETVNLAMRPADGSAPSTLTATVTVPYFVTGDPNQRYLRKSVSFRVGG